MRREIRMRDEVVVETWCSSKGNKSLTIQQRIFANGDLATESEIVLVGFV